MTANHSSCDAVAIPLKWSNSAAVASLEDGYALAANLGLGDLNAWANNRFNAASSSGLWIGNATELWLCLYYEHRRWRHFGENPDGVDLQLLDNLCTALQLAIVGGKQLILTAAEADSLGLFGCPVH